MYQTRYDVYSDWLDSYYEQLRAAAREAFLKRRFCRNQSRRVEVSNTSPIGLRPIGYQDGHPP